MGQFLRKALRFDPGRALTGQYDRFFQFAHARQRASWTLLTFGMPMLFIMGWLRDRSAFGEAAQDMLLVRLWLVAVLLLTAILTLRAGMRRADLMTIVYAALFSTSIMVVTAMDIARLSMTHVAAMLMLIIMLPYALRAIAAAGMVLALCIPMFALLAWLHVAPGLWLAYAAFAVVGIVIGLAQRNANLNTVLELFLHRQRLLKRLHTDTLTGLANREGWDNGAMRMRAAHAQDGHLLALLFMDLDHFKSINDGHGHATGDGVLTAVGEVLLRELRNDDLAARIGGEEFVILLANSDSASALATAERLCRSVERAAGPVPVTASIGIVMVDPDETLDAALHRADLAMLEAKRQGRNRVVGTEVQGNNAELVLPDR